MKRKGQMLVEAVVALSVLTVGFLGILTLLSRSTALTRVVGDNYIATYLAAEGIEIIKNLVDANIIQKNDGRSWDEGFVNAVSYEVDYRDDKPESLETFQNRFLKFNSGTHLYSYDAAGSPTPFKRIVTVTFPNFPNVDEMQVVSEVFWRGRGGSNSRVSVEDHFYNWRP